MVEVEVTVQDCFYNNFPLETVNDTSNNVITDTNWENWFQQWLETLYTELPAAKSYELSLRLTDDAEIQSLNAQYRQKNQPTDVLAFAALEVDYPQMPMEFLESMPLYLGDIVISINTAQRQAQQQGHSLTTELAWLAAHGLLHLIGWDHPDESSLLRMLNKQENLLKAVGLNISFL